LAFAGAACKSNLAAAHNVSSPPLH
jgi:hypothetical protein